MSADGAALDFDGVEWETFCRAALSRKYGAAWQKIPAKNRGDWGLEGFVRGQGIVVQCYADDSVSNADRTRKQKGKLTADVPKLHRYRDALETHLEMPVDTYLFLVPSFDDKDLLGHAQSKSQMVRRWALPWIATNFAIAVHDLDFLREEWEALRGSLRHVLDLAGATPLASPPLGGPLVDNLVRKLDAIPRLAGDPAQSRLWKESLLDDYVRGGGRLLELDDVNPEYADRIIRIIDGREGRLARRSGASEPLDDLNILSADLAEAIHRDISAIDDADAQSVAGSVVADWLMRCPLEYVP
jgi:hypothetical protein